MPTVTSRTSSWWRSARIREKSSLRRQGPRDQDRNLDETEMSVNGAHDFIIADEDEDGSLSPGEFVVGFPILARIAKALR
jgi:hypothetical protein